MEPAQTAPRVLLLGCSELRGKLRDGGLSTASVRGLRQLLEREAELDARAIVIGPAALASLTVESVVPRLRNAWPLVDVILWWPRASGSTVRAALKAGARDVILAASADACAREISRIVAAQQLLPRAARMGDVGRKSEASFEGMVARSRRMWDLFDMATQVAQTDATVLILGETGTGKELLARAIHRRSQRAGRFVAVNCGGVTETLIDSELFGHVRGAFTGATQEKAGLFRHAHEGTLMLDEIGNVPLTAQYRLLRVLQEETVRPVGGHQEIPIDVRVIAATSRPLEDDVEAGRFREDLFYRLDVIRLEIPPLRERPEDVIFLFGQFARRLSEQYNIVRPDVSEEFLDALVGYEWPGNVRQLENLTERLVLTNAGGRLTSDAIKRAMPFRKRPPEEEAQRGAARRASQRGTDNGAERIEVDLDRTLAEHVAARVERVERAYIDRCLEAARGRIGDAAERAGISRRTLLRKLRHYGIDKADYR
ncbi:MAG: sigma-54-dependent Fis family transcriptional regulator [Myxococcales bacterium]|nr:sigma-54-dependent Fis family transcriptional regulator [Myxococcales bacterium]